MKRFVLGLTVLALACSSAWAHGGAYRGPAGEVPPNLRKPQDPPPPPDGGTPTPPPEEGPGGTPTPPDAGPGRGAPPPPPGSNPNGPGNVGGGVPGGGAPSGGTTTQPGKKAAGPKALSYESWMFWWAYNKDVILQLKSALKQFEKGIQSGSAIGSFGRKHDRNKSDTATPTEEKILNVVLPALEKANDSKLHFDIQAGAVIALGKVGSTQPKHSARIAKALIDIMKNKDGSSHFSVEESGALALGLLQNKDEGILTALCDTLTDGRARQRTRAFAAIALGLLEVAKDDAGYELVTETLRSIMKSSKEAQQDVQVCALIGMGLSGDVVFVDELLPMVKDSRAYKTTKLNDVVRSYAAAAIGKIGSRNPDVARKEVIDVLKRAMTGKGAHTVRSAVIAYGQIGQQAGLEAGIMADMVKALAYVANRGEGQAQNYALIALGKIGGAAQDLSLRNKVYATLSRAMTKGSFTGKPFAGLALGLMGRTMSGKSADTAKESIRDAVRYEFDNYRGAPTNRGAYAIALGMLKDKKSVPAMIKVLADRGEERKLRGFVAVALGMIGDGSAKKAIKDALMEKQDRDLRVDTAVAAGLIGDSSAIAALVSILNEDKVSLFVQGSVTLALGSIGDARAIDPLVKIVQDGRTPDLNRALAAVALGNLGDRNDVPVLSRLSEDVNYRATINSVQEVLSIL